MTVNSAHSNARRFIPETHEEFLAILHGERKVKPKILIDPTDGAYYRLITDDPSSLTLAKGRYVKIDLPSTDVHFFEMYEDVLQRYAHEELKPLPEGMHIRQLHLQKDVSRAPTEDEISPRQLYHLMSKMGDDSGWWPIEDPRYGAETYFAKQKINVLFDGNKPIGAHMWDDSRWDKGHEIIGSFIGIVPEYRGMGLGSHMIKWGLKTLGQKGCKKYYLNTADDDIMPSKTAPEGTIPAKILYEKLGFTYVRTETLNPYELGPDSVGQDGIPLNFSKMTMSDEFYRHPDTNEILGRFTAARFNQQSGDTPSANLVA